MQAKDKNYCTVFILELVEKHALILFCFAAVGLKKDHVFKIHNIARIKIGKLCFCSRNLRWRVSFQNNSDLKAEKMLQDLFRICLVHKHYWGVFFSGLKL
jgi:hypothetical protein